MKHDLFTDSQDPVEQAWAREIDRWFPYYAVFWNELVGWKKPEGKAPHKLSGYGLRFPNAMAKEDQGFILDQYQMICQTHYSLFCHLAGAHYQLSKLKRTRPREPMRSFLYFEILGNLYNRLASALEMLRLLWACFYELRNKAPYKPKAFVRQVRRQFERDLKTYQLLESYKELVREVIRYQRAFSRLQRYATVVENGRVYVPKGCKKNYPFFQKESFKDLIDCKLKAAEDLEAVEIFVNCLYSEYLKNIKMWLATRGIGINHGKQTRLTPLKSTEVEAENQMESLQSLPNALVKLSVLGDNPISLVPDKAIGIAVSDSPKIK